MKKYFITSDIHSFYTPLKEALDQAEFDLNNPEHVLIVLGDIFDRGDETNEIYDFLRYQIPKERRILIRGNHELLLKDLVERGYYQSHDIHNGTYKTLCQIANLDYEFERQLLLKYLLAPTQKYQVLDYDERNEIYEKKVLEKRHKLYHNRKITQILKWIDSDEWVNYCELGKYIFVHSFIPTRVNKDAGQLGYYLGMEEYDPDWRNSNDWSDAVWGCPWKQYKSGWFDVEKEKGKILVCGHWHSSDFFNNLLYEDEPEKWLDTYKDNPIFRHKDFNIIAIDGCCAATNKLNVLVLNEDEL